MPEVEERTGFYRTSIYERVAAGKFPRQLNLEMRRDGRASIVGWVESEIDAWVKEKIAASRQPPGDAARKAEREVVPISRLGTGSDHPGRASKKRAGPLVERSGNVSRKERAGGQPLASAAQLASACEAQQQRESAVRVGAHDSFRSRARASTHAACIARARHFHQSRWERLALDSNDRPPLAHG